MIVSWNWLAQYLPLDMPHEELTRRLMMAGLNHEQTEPWEDDWAIDVEVTSNRPDCLGHLGIAREVAALFDVPLTLPAAAPNEQGDAVEKLAKVRIDCPDLCYRYTARVIRNVKVGPSPLWMARRLEAVGLVPVNNIVDISNYVMLECGQPLHTFDYAKLQGPEIIVRRPKAQESIEAIDHKTYALPADSCVIADASRPVAIGGVMGGASTEISSRTRGVLVEAAEFSPVSIRNTARLLNLHSDSSYRFERKIDPEGVDWASRRCCELILELAGGELAPGVIDVVARPAPKREPIRFRFSQLKRVLGIEVPTERVHAILHKLGVEKQTATAAEAAYLAPSWRRDLTREIDLVEEVARIHGYEQIPEDVRVPMSSSLRTRDEKVMNKVRAALTGAGFDEALSLSVTDEATAGLFSPWTDQPPLRSQSPVLRGADCLRRSLIPSLLVLRRSNEAAGNADIELFETAKIYLNQPGGLPCEELMVGLTSGRGYAQVRGAIEALLAAINPTLRLTASDFAGDLLDRQAACWLSIGDRRLGLLGEVSADSRAKFDLRGPTVVAELRLDLLAELADLVPRYQPLPSYPSVSRDLNLVVDEPVRWADLAATVEAASGEHFEKLTYRDTYRDPQRLGVGKKSLLMSLDLRWRQGTLTNQEADQIRDRIVAACRDKHGAELRA